MEQQIELGAEVLHGKSATNPLYQLAEEHQLIDYNDGKLNTSIIIRSTCYYGNFRTLVLQSETVSKGFRIFSFSLPYSCDEDISKLDLINLIITSSAEYFLSFKMTLIVMIAIMMKTVNLLMMMLSMK